VALSATPLIANLPWLLAGKMILAELVSGDGCGITRD
jgi:hypothetical protein